MNLIIKHDAPHKEAIWGVLGYVQTMQRMRVTLPVFI